MSAIQEEEFTQSKVQWSTWKKLLSYTRPHRRSVAMTLLAMAVVAMADVVGPYLNGYAIDTFITLSSRRMSLGSRPAAWAASSIREFSSESMSTPRGRYSRVGTQPSATDPVKASIFGL